MRAKIQFINFNIILQIPYQGTQSRQGQNSVSERFMAIFRDVKTCMYEENNDSNGRGGGILDSKV